MDQWESEHVRSVLSEFPSARRNFVGLIVGGLLVLPLLAGLLWFFATSAAALGPADVHPNVTLGLFIAAGATSLSSVLCVLVGLIRLLSAVQAHLRIGQYHG